MSKKINVFCIKWGTQFGPEYVNNLYSMVVRNTSYDINFYCFTDNGKNLNENITVKPLPDLDLNDEDKKKYNYVRTAGYCDDNIANLSGERIFCFDLDVVIISNLDELFSYPNDDGFYIIKDWNSKGNRVGQGSCYSWVVGSLGFIKEHFEQNSQMVINTYSTATQKYLSDMIIQKFGKLNFWPESWFCSFRFHCVPKFFLFRHFFEPKIPKDRKGLKVVVFHGVPNPTEALKGWSVKKPFFKKIYKKCLPTTWITDYWK